MSESDTESGPGSDNDSEGISDEQLPEDLQPGEENPLASPPEGDAEEIDRDELDVLDGKTPEESEGDQDG